MTTKEKLKTYQELYPDYHITGVKKMTLEEIKSREHYGYDSLYELYDKPSEAKDSSYRELLERYNPQSVLAVTGNSMAYSVLLVAENGVTMHITRDNNYLVEVVA